MKLSIYNEGPEFDNRWSCSLNSMKGTWGADDDKHAIQDIDLDKVLAEDGEMETNKEALKTLFSLIGMSIEFEDAVRLVVITALRRGIEIGSSLHDQPKS